MNKDITGSKVVLDSNAIIYYVKGENSLEHIIENNLLFASIISEIEVFGYEMSANQVQYFTELFEDITLQPITNDIKRKAIYFKRVYNLKTADSIVAATAYSLNLPLISADRIYSRVEEIQFFQVSVTD